MDVAFRNSFQRFGFQVPQHGAELAVDSLRVGQKLKLVAGMKLDQRLGGKLVAGHVLHPVVVGKYTLNEVFPDHVVIETSFFLHRHQRISLQQRLGEHAPAIAADDIAILIVNLDPLHAAAGGLGHQDVAAQVSQGGHDLVDKALHGIGMVRSPLGFDQAQAVTVLAQVDGRAWNAQARFQLRADGAEIKML